MAHLIGGCLARQREIVRKVSPDAVCYVWGDMLDPNHNARDGYANTHGSYTGIAKCIPQDLVIVPWWGEKAAQQVEYWRVSGRVLRPRWSGEREGLAGGRKAVSGIRDWVHLLHLAHELWRTGELLETDV